MAEEVDIRFLLNSPEVEQEAARTKAAITGVEKATLATGKTMQSAFEGGGAALENVSENIKIQKRVLADLEKQYRDTQKSVNKMPAGSPARQSAQRELGTAKAEIEAERRALTELEAAQRQYDQSTVSMRTKIRMLKEEMSRMVEGTAEYERKMHELGDLQDRYGDISAQGRVFADDERYFRASTETIQGLAGAMSMATGVASLFGASQENLAKIQARLQAVMAISIGVQQVAQVLNKDSYFSHIVLAKAKNIVTAATTRLSVALGISNVAAKALMATLTLGLSVVITAAIAAISKMQSASQQAREQAEKMNKSVAESAGASIAKFEKLNAEWDKLKDKDRSQWVTDNKKAFDDLGVSINTAADADKLFTDQKDAFVDSLMARAKAMAAWELAQEKFKKAIALQLEAEAMPETTLRGGSSGPNWGGMSYSYTVENKKRTKKLAEAAKERTVGEGLIKTSASETQKANDIVSGMGLKTAEDIEREKQEKEAAQKRAEAAKKAAEDTRRNADELKKLRVKLAADAAQAEIAALNDGLDKSLQQSELNYQRRLAQIKEQQAELLAARQKTLPKGKKAELTDDEKAGFAALNKAAAAERDAAGNELRAREQERLAGMLADFQTYQERATAIQKKYDEIRSHIAAKNADGTWTANEGKEETFANVNDAEQGDIDALDLMYAEKEGAFRAWMNQIATQSLEELRATLQKAQEALTAAKAAGGDSKTLATAKAKVNEAQKAVTKAEEEAVTETDPDKQFKAWQKLYGTLQKVEREFGQIGDAVGGTAGDIIKTAGSIATSTLGILNGILTYSTIATATIVGVSQTAATAIKTVEKASVVLAIIGAIISVLQSVAKLFKKNDYMEKYLAEVAALNYELSALKLNAKIESNVHNTIFGVDMWRKAKEVVEASRESLERYNGSVDKIINRKHGLSGFFGALAEKLGVGSQSFDSLAESIGKMDVMIKHGTWFRSAKYQSLRDAVPELFNANGTVNMDALKGFVGSETFSKLSEQNQTYLKNLSNDWELYEKAVEEVSTYLTDIFGELGQSMSDALVSAFVNGTDAAAAFTKSVSQMLETLAAQMIYSVTLGPMMDKYQEQFKEVMNAAGMTDKDKFTSFTKILSELTDEAIASQGMANDLMQWYKDEAAKKGLNIFEADKESTKSGSSGQLQAEMTEGTGSQLVGLWSMTSIDTRTLRELTQGLSGDVRAMLPDVHQILATMLLIEQHTRATAGNTADTVKELKEGFEQMHNQLDDIIENTKGSNSRR